ncbi:MULTISPECIES: circularly permuted type 2 ATP-grasp protein [Paraburkholderia]|uniref:circularly permuted type 2 ATP-grasp protein n=1 Tax=Paraburkholderia TaxID=1822464 RepID=UPI0022512DE5|nr:MULTISPECIES: circularly permuted type 2 ATP-grasp protein [Paraburkholderia]MCX4163509.1 circularly permuted type 2 ATP-grasp protein [Paraburkholderia megapolitana]MDN7159004.1 circularly permuted type 2 ATP-grasp protein [Paraburkholderia sp. CHISQ3]MDQ6496051.1 circularly permuted type 2 ATP-grasp protein [Paraburkholderia megapolitana]
MAFQSTLPFDITATQPDALALLHALPAREGHREELRDETGALRAPWRQFFDLLGEEGIAGLDHGIASVAQQIRDNDISYNVYADKGESRPWALDLLPFLIDEEEWALIARGVAQRARLIEAIVADIYGPQTLLQRGLLPPALVFGHPGYLRAVRGFKPASGQYLQIVAVDLARAPDGAWTVMSHRTEAPSGLGYALENRLIVSSLFADPFRAMRVSRLAPSYSQLVATLAQAARATMRDGDREESPHIALLTPGPFSETYFEHVFLARYLGVTLVEGKDLTVRDDKLYLKTLAGLERVHAVLRRLDDAFCDPVELRADSTIGVPGLLQVMRAGNVMVSNVPGSGFAESPALHGFMPGISQALLGEPLALPAVPTWWCGEEAARQEAFAQRYSAFLLPTWPGAQGGTSGTSGASSGWPLGIAPGPQRLADWRERIESTPESYTIQAPLPYSCTPRYEEGTLGARPSVLRVYAIAGIDGQWSVLPGGFTRLAAERQATVSMQHGGSSVDTWVLSSQAGSTLSLLPSPMQPGDLARKHRTVSSRAAENLFWAGRYGERAENNVRLCRLILGSLEGSDADEMFATLAELASQCGLIPSVDTLAHTSPQAFERTLIAGMSEASGETSIGQNLASQVRACGEIRGRLSNDHWRTILAARNDFRDAQHRLVLASGVGRYDRVMLADALEYLATQLSAISGAQGDRMMRDEAWRLLFVGRHIERVVTMCTFLRAVAGQGTLARPAGFDLLLQLFDCTLTYRSLYPGRFEVPALIDMLVVDQTNPRGLYGVYTRLRKKLDEIAAAAGSTRRMPFSELMPPIASLPPLEALCESDAEGGYPALIDLCDQLSQYMAAASNEISGRYFSHANTQLSAQVQVQTQTQVSA